MSFEYKNPKSSVVLSGPNSVPLDSNTGSNFSSFQVGGFYEVFKLSDLNFTIPSGTTGTILYSGNTIPIDFSYNAPNNSPNVINLYSDGVSSGRRKLGMIAYVYENNKTYQYQIPNYETLFNNAVNAGSVVNIDFGYQVYDNTVDGTNLLNAWTGSTIEGISGITRDNARWVEFNPEIYITGGTYSSGDTTLYLYDNSGNTIAVSGFSVSVSGGTSGTSGDSTGTSGSSGTSGTQGTSGSSGTSGTSGTSGSSGTTGTSGTSGSSGVNGISAGQSYYFNESQDSDIIGYKVLSLEPSGAIQATISTLINGSTSNVLISDYITPELGFAVIPGGVQRFHLHFLKPASNDNLEAYVQIQLADFSGGTLGPPLVTNTTLIGWVDDTTPVETTMDLVLPTTTIDPTNRMIVKIYVSNLNSTNHNINYYTEGISYYSFVLTSVGAIAGSSGISGSSGTSAQPLTELSISGVTNGSNRTFTISQAINGSVSLFFVNGQLQQYGVDYTIVGDQLIIDSQNPAPTPNYILKIFGGIILGVNGTSGTSGGTGSSGQTGTAGTSGTSGGTGSSGQTGSSGTSGINGDPIKLITLTGDLNGLNKIKFTNLFTVVQTVTIFLSLCFFIFVLSLIHI